MAVTIEKGGIYTFTTVHPGVLGSLFEKARCTADMEYSTAKLIDSNIDSLQSAVAPYLDPNVSRKHTLYTYFVFVTQTGEKKVFAREWINVSSIKQDITDFLDVRIIGAKESDMAAIRNVLGLSGWNIVNIIT